MSVNLNEIIEKALEESLEDPERRGLLLASLSNRSPWLDVLSRPGEQLRSDVIALSRPRGDLATWLDNAAGLAVRQSGWFQIQAERLRAGDSVELHDVSAPTTVGRAIELAVRFDREEPWRALTEAAARGRSLFFPVVGCSRQGVHLFLRCVGITPPVARARPTLVRFDRSGDRAPPQTAGEWEAALAAPLGATTLIEGIQRAGGPVFLLLGPLPADDLRKTEKRGLEAFLTERLPALLNAVPTPVLTLVGIDYPSGGRKAFPIKPFRAEVVGWAKSVGFQESPDAPRYLLQTTDLTIPEWSHADRLLLSEGIAFEEREDIRRHYEKWRKTMSFEQIARELDRELKRKEDDE